MRSGAREQYQARQPSNIPRQLSFVSLNDIKPSGRAALTGSLKAMPKLVAEKGGTQQYQPLKVDEDAEGRNDLVVCRELGQGQKPLEREPSILWRAGGMDQYSSRLFDQKAQKVTIRRNLCSQVNLAAIEAMDDADVLRRHYKRVSLVCGRKLNQLSQALLSNFRANQHQQGIRVVFNVRQDVLQSLKYKLVDETYFQIVQKRYLELGASQFNKLVFGHFARMKQQADPYKVEGWQICGMSFAVDDMERCSTQDEDKKRIQDAKKMVRKSFDDLEELLGKQEGMLFFNYVSGLKWQNSGFKKLQWHVFEPFPCSQLLPQVRALIFFAMAADQR